ncbi:ATP-binding cassette domain-containing protein [Leucobacter coleopterorum]|uniref:ATP-binding cassette domain-containing protein n=1 Tax=Leucobacter coleopterorum TaxID=2714933 RepID=A0ABX6K1S9_9MICO|nr:ATP-binding cassette domain-containing protein [Leucobacter coleopterorum]QIM19065.1 ATP-binding cassette domain-containing protein [Leucobacter coleopterorum]
MIEFKNVVKTYDNGHTAVSDLSFTAPTGKITVLVGPSGCGKTTTLRMVNRLIEQSSGSILLDGEDNAKTDTIRMRRKIGYVIQNAGLFPHQTVLDNVCAVPFLEKQEKKASRERALELLTLVGLDQSYANRYPWQLSGGQQQRVGVARALAADPPFMLMDEPFSAVDPIVRKQLQAEFLKIQANLAKTIVMVTHDINEALKLGDQIVVLQEGGILAQIGSPAEILAHPAGQFVADFLGESRGYHALNFEQISTLLLDDSPKLRLGDIAPSHLHGSWVVACDGNNRPLGWTLAGDRHVTAEDINLSMTVQHSTGNFRELLDASLASPNGRAILTDDNEQYLGTLSSELVMQRATQSLRAEETLA